MPRSTSDVKADAAAFSCFALYKSLSCHREVPEDEQQHLIQEPRQDLFLSDLVNRKTEMPG